MLIHGDNLLALKALESKYAGQVKCIYIDPPYNTGNAFEHYDDNLEHSIWLNLMRPRFRRTKICSASFWSRKPTNIRKNLYTCVSTMILPCVRFSK
ncbi:MAG: site-specific DNA-methyltransferase [Bacteroides sp.]|nr:site-specific DNA-methyltransferase [Prevotella sp.]MCM1407827.1 site-specific DNA-methyltransferase [Treponema brennaborense]MCM1470880.1 site-specific DNA-methyltransferase [Bacteroides sp.]